MGARSIRMTNTQFEAANLWLQRNWSEPRKCPVSGHSSWMVAEHFISPPIVAPPLTPGEALGLFGLASAATPTTPTTTETQYPQVMVICRHCGYTMYFNAVAMGLVPSGGQDNVSS